MSNCFGTKIGVFGGAFDPVHCEHVHLVKQAIAELGLERVIVVPSYSAPHKLTTTSFEDRVAMLRIAFADIEQVRIDTIESQVDGHTYSAVVLPKLDAKVGKFVHLIGGDSFCNILNWYHPQEVLTYPTAVFARGDDKAKCLAYADTIRSRFGAQIAVLQEAGAPVSSTDIRLSLAVGREPNCLPEGVYSYVAKHSLYAPFADIVKDLSSSLAPARWAHVQEVALFACKLAPSLGLPVEKVLLAGLLHDCAKTADGGKQYEYLCNDIPADCRQPAVLHAFVGALVASSRYGVKDTDVLNAVRYHTTGRAGMSPLEKLIYLADYAEPTRTHDGAAQVRALALLDFDQAFALAVANTYHHIENCADLCPLGDECYRYYIQGEQNDQ